MQADSLNSEHLVRADAQKRGWQVVRRIREIGVVGVPCFVEPDVPGNCEIWVGTGENSSQLEISFEWQHSSRHVANIRKLNNGKVYDRGGQPIGNWIGSEGNSSCSISIKKDGGEYLDAWEALKTYTSTIYSGFLSFDTETHLQAVRPYTFDIPGERSRNEIQWLDLVRTQKIAIVGLGGVGAWIADLLVKSDVAEIHGWDHDEIEAKNIIRMPGAVNPNWIGKKKARWFQDTYSQVHNNVIGHEQKVTEHNADKVGAGISFGFIAVDRDDARTAAIDAFSNRRIPFVDIGLSPSRTDRKVDVSIRIIIARPYLEGWRAAVPVVDQVGQGIYGRLELPDLNATAAGLAVQNWRKFCGQMGEATSVECLVYQSESSKIILRPVS